MNIPREYDRVSYDDANAVTVFNYNHKSESGFKIELNEGTGSAFMEVTSEDDHQYNTRNSDDNALLVVNEGHL